MNSASDKGKAESGNKRLEQNQEHMPLLTDLREAGQNGYGVDALTLAQDLGLEYSGVVENIEHTAEMLKDLAPDFLAINFGNGTVMTEDGEEVETHIMTPIGALFILMGLEHKKALIARLKLMNDAVCTVRNRKDKRRSRKR